MLTRYRDVVSTPGAAAFSAAAGLARLPLSMAALGIILVVSERSGSYGHAGVLAAAYVVAAAACAPVQGRLVDRLGQGRVLWVVGGAYALGMALLVLAIGRDLPAPVPHACAALAGSAAPQTGSMARARWIRAVDDRERLNTAFSIEAVLDEVVFVVGPVLVTWLTLQVTDFAGLGLAAACALVGSWTLALQRSTEPPVGTHESGHREPIGLGAVVPLTVVGVAMGTYFGATEVIVVAFAKADGRPDAAGTVLAIWAGGSLVAGLVVGAMPRPRDLLRRFRWSLTFMTLLLVPLGFLPSTVWLAVGLFLAGSMLSPSLISMVNLVEVHVPSSRLTEALTWTTMGMAVGVAPGAAISGWVIDEHGASAGFVVPVVAVLIASAVAWAFRPADTHAAA